MATETLGAHLRNLLTPYRTLLDLVNDAVNGDFDIDIFKKINCDNINELIEFSHSDKMENTIWKSDECIDTIIEEIDRLLGIYTSDNYKSADILTNDGRISALNEIKQFAENGKKDIKKEVMACIHNELEYEQYRNLKVKIDDYYMATPEEI